ncbi:unnamed protein product [Phytophthora fragariaefolia]|uniref:Unnamed protein product n=1 Tax=Phytophthora fragariaefolia TaxID=1490495 RepID=A0A9W6WX09_9STRA|nr:unnamed protein product [Phytophthora fragariaefolia]
MPFVLKNAPLVYQAVVDNCLWGFVRLSPEEEAEVDPEVLRFFKLDPAEPRSSGDSTSEMTVLAQEMMVFQ